jgi:hypothetical protein
MIIRGGPVGNVKWWSDHLQRDDTNEKVEVREIRGLTADNLQDALWEMKWVAAGSRSQGNFMYQANINPYDHEHLTDEQWAQAVDTLEKNLGLEGHQRVVVEHVKEGRQHFHIMWNRVDVDTMRVVDARGNWKIHEATQAELEAAFDLTPTPAKNPDRAPAAELWELRAAARTGIDRDEVRNELTALWRASDSGQAFKAAIEERGYVLARGDKADFCVVDHAGNAPNLVRRLDGVRTAEMRAQMADVDREKLPSVAAARQAQQERFPDPGKAWSERNQVGELARSADSFWERRIAANRPEARAGDDWLPPRFEGARDEVFPRWTGEGISEERAPEPAAEAPRGDRTTRDIREDRSAAKEPRDGAAAEDGLSGAEKMGLGVVNAATGGVEKLADFAANFLAGGEAKRENPAAEHADRIAVQRRALDALKRIRDNIERGRNLKPEDVQNLTPNHLQNIAQRGDAYLQDIIRRMEEDERRRSMERGRERER